MKLELSRAWILLSISVLCLPLSAQDAAAPRPPANPAATAAAVAEQQGFDEKFKQLAADLETLRAANQLLQTKLSALQEELDKVRSDQTRQSSGSLSRDDLKPLTQKIDEVDKRRLEDKDAILENIKNTTERLEKLLTNPADPAPKPPIRGSAPPSPPAAPEGVTYTVKDGDRLTAIVAAYNTVFISKHFKTITPQQVKDANPTVDWSRLKIGQKIVIPCPPGFPTS
jgi:LysM repeat protein